MGHDWLRSCRMRSILSGPAATREVVRHPEASSGAVGLQAQMKTSLEWPS